jgi:exoribonuclease-2
LGRGEYVLEMANEKPLGHFGLAVRDYTHSTAPNRRFPDLITQRLLKSALAKEPSPYSIGELNDLASHCTSQEDCADKVERQVRKSASALFLSKDVGKQFDAVVTGASEKGTFGRVFHPPVEGMIVRGQRGLEVGDKVRLKLVEVDVEKGFIDFARVT